VADVREMALGIASTPRSGIAPNPLPVEFWDYAPDGGADLLRHLADECADGGGAKAVRGFILVSPRPMFHHLPSRCLKRLGSWSV